MTLKEYLRAEGRKLNWLADKAGVSFTNLSRLMNGHHKPDYNTRLKIEAATDGHVTKDDWE